MVLVSSELNPCACLEFEADIYVLFHTHYICKGFQTVIHVGNVMQTAIILRIDKVGHLQLCKASLAVLVLTHGYETLPSELHVRSSFGCSILCLFSNTLFSLRLSFLLSKFWMLCCLHAASHV